MQRNNSLIMLSILLISMAPADFLLELTTANPSIMTVHFGLNLSVTKISQY